MSLCVKLKNALKQKEKYAYYYLDKSGSYPKTHRQYA